MNQLAIYKQQGLGKRLAETKVGGFFTRLLGRIKRSVLMQIPIVGTLVNIGEALLQVGDYLGGDSYKITDDSLTPTEQTVLDTWDETAFLPFYKGLLTETAAIFSPGITLDEQVSRANKVLGTICGAIAHYNVTPGAFLSVNAFNIRRDYVRTSLGVIQKYIATQFSDNSFAKSIEALNMANFYFVDLFPRSGVTAFNCEIYSKTASTNDSPIVAEPIEIDGEIITPLEQTGTSYVVPGLFAALLLALLISKSKSTKNVSI